MTLQSDDLRALAGRLRKADDLRATNDPAAHAEAFATVAEVTEIIRWEIDDLRRRIAECEWEPAPCDICLALERRAQDLLKVLFFIDHPDGEVS